MVIPSLQAGGMERVMSELTGYFSSKRDIEVHLILYDLSREVFYQIPDSVIIHKPSFNFNNKFRFFYTLKTLYYLRYTIKQIDPKSILSFGEYWNNFFLLAVFGLKYATFVSDRSQPDKSLGWFHDKLRHWLYPMTTGLIFQTEKAREIFLITNKHPNTIVIGNPIREICYKGIPFKREKIILMVGRFIKTKHQDKLIEIFAKINHPDWKLMFVGYDHLKQNNMERLRMLAKDLNIEQRVLFTGKQDNIDEIYLKSSIFAFTSSSEGFPNVIGEAMAARLPIIAFDCVAGPSEMIKDNHNGFLIPLFDYQQFQEKLEVLMNREDLRTHFGKKACENIKRFSVTRTGDKYLQFILSNN
jgi:GalNAc-alpha-(1->4)-GalNAc-alpha-(1->3)-diNAcBac-PP-undecaprenol alpha-1,4-N-acetyl-D-galactosaminyltransferase